MQTGNKGMGSHKHYLAGSGGKRRNGKSPKLRHAIKREAESVSIKARGRIRQPKASVKELFYGK